jgi:sugar/nucleoside kinase (ribokinase family)
MTGMAPYDVLGLGCVATDDLLYVASYPSPDTKQQVRRRERQCGGLTATALVAAARLGARCVYAGTLGDDDLSRWVVDCLGREGIDTSLVCRRPGARPIHSIVIVDESQQTRTILYDLQDVYGAQQDWPTEDVIRAACVLFVDHFGVEGMIRAAKVARQAGIPVVADLESDEMPEFPELLALVDHLICSHEFARRLTAESDPGAAVSRLWREDREAVIVTCGAAGGWYRHRRGSPSAEHYPAFAVPALDTTGCGDVFHGAYAAALARELPFPERIRFAAAAAALKATRRGGQAGIPTRSAVESLLKEHRA